VEIPAELAGWQFRPGKLLEPSIAHGSLNVEDVVQIGDPGPTIDDDNALRRAYLFGMYDLCWGGDFQVLRALKEENRIYSHDHGWYLPPEGAGWSEDALMANLAQSHELGLTIAGITPDAVAEVAASMERLTRDMILGALGTIPREWPVTNQELECVGFFIEARAPAVVQRLRQRFGLML